MANRREFLKLAGAAVASGVTIPALARRREPYVIAGEIVDSIIWHRWDDPRNPAPSGPLWVGEIKAWDGVGYPIVLMGCGSRLEDRQYIPNFYDFEWVNFRRELPDRFWAIPGNAERYPNVHSFIRERRFGEHPDVMRQTMAANAGGTLA